MKYLLIVLTLLASVAIAQVQTMTVPLLDAQGNDTGDQVSVNASIVITRDGGTNPPPPPPPPTGNLLGALENIIMNEETQNITVLPITDSGARVFVSGLPKGTLWHEPTRTITLFPDFTQSGDYTVTIDAYNASETATGTFIIRVNNTIQPPDPVVTQTTPIWKATSYNATLTSDGFLDPPGEAGKTYSFGFVVPENASENNLFPMRIYLHGSGGSGSAGGGDGSRFSFGPHEDFIGWHTGKHNNYPGAATGNTEFSPTTQRKIIHILDWITRNYPGVDRDRVGVTGASMGGSGAMFLTLRYGYHLSTASSGAGMTSIILSTQYQRDQMEQYWGTRAQNLSDDLGISVWDRYDITRGFRDQPWMRDIYYYAKNGNTDNIIRFHHFSTPSPNTNVSFVDGLQQYQIPHRVYWDKSGHGVGDTDIAAFWEGSRNSKSTIALDKAIPAFSNSSMDWDPPLYDLNTDSFIGNDLIGARNRHLSWVTADIVDTHTAFEIPLFVATQSPDPNQDPNIPVVGDGWPGALPVTADVTLRRVQHFKCLPGEVVNWTFGAQSGQATADSDGIIKITGLSIDATETPLVLSRTTWPQ